MIALKSPPVVRIIDNVESFGGESAADYAALPTPRHAVDYIMDTFPIVRRKDEAVYGSYRTKEAILREYDGMLETIVNEKSI